jgi:hypothetical protein
LAPAAALESAQEAVLAWVLVEGRAWARAVAQVLGPVAAAWASALESVPVPVPANLKRFHRSSQAVGSTR